MKTPHVHTTIIKAWADGAQIEVRVNDAKPWYPEGQYRVKPEPKPDGV